MGVGGKKPPMREIDETRGAGRDDAFEAIVSRIKSAGGEVSQDETYPMYAEFGTEEVETGYERVVVFNLNRFDFQLTRRVETQGIQGEGHQKHIEPFNPPRIKLILKRKPDNTQNWQLMDLEDMF